MLQRFQWPAYINATDSFGLTLLHHAAREKQPKILCQLLDRADIVNCLTHPSTPPARWTALMVLANTAAERKDSRMEAEYRCWKALIEAMSFEAISQQSDKQATVPILSHINLH